MRTWIRPSAIEENFASNQNIANDSVSACYSLYCKVAGDGRGNFKTDTDFNFGPNTGYKQPFQWGNEWVTPDGKSHGIPCACGSSYDKKTKKFYETGKQVFATDINISDIYGPDAPGYQATWKSTDDTTYQHYGYAINDQPNKPHHS